MVLGSGIRDPGSGIRKKPIPDPGSRGQKAPDPGSRIRIRNTDIYYFCQIPAKEQCLPHSAQSDYTFPDEIKRKMHSNKEFKIKIFLIFEHRAYFQSGFKK
jgi:hypothetical protein